MCPLILWDPSLGAPMSRITYFPVATEPPVTSALLLVQPAVKAVSHPSIVSPLNVLIALIACAPLNGALPMGF